MEKNIYEQMSDLRPSKKGQIAPAPEASRPPQTSSETPVSEDRAEEELVDESVSQSTLGELPTDSHLAASLRSLQKRSPLRTAQPGTQAPAMPDPPMAPPATLPEEPEVESPGSKRQQRRHRKALAKQQAQAEQSALKEEKAIAKQRHKDQKAGAKQAKQNARDEAKQAKLDKKAAGKPSTLETPKNQTPADVDGPDTSNTEPKPKSEIAPPPGPLHLDRVRDEEPAVVAAPPSGASWRQDWKANRISKRAARQAVAEERRRAKARIATATRRSKSKEYHLSKVPNGSWTGPETRQHMRAARREAKAELKQIRAEVTGQVQTAQNQVKVQTDKRRNRRRQEDRDRSAHLAGSRLRSIRLGLAGSWVGIGGFAWYLWSIDRLHDDELLIPLIAITAGTSVFTLVPWKRILERRVAPVLMFLWLTMLTAGMVATAPFHDATLGLFVAAAWIIIYGGVLLGPIGFAITASGTLAGYGVAISISPIQVSEYGQVFRVAALAATAVIVGITIHELRSIATETVRRLHAINRQREALRKRESELMQLYEVSRTIGLGEDLREVLPELVARTAGYVEAKVGLVVLHRPEEQILAALSPIWVAGQALEAEGYEFEVSGDATAATVFASGAPYMSNHLDSVDLSGDRMLADLGVERVAAVPLRVEGRTIGALIVADKATDFTHADLAALELLATPAGLVLDHLARLEQSQETGRRMAELAQLKSDFVSVVSHELRTPLTSVIGALSTLARPELAPDNPTSLSLLDSASTQANRLKLLIEDLLTVSKIDNEALPIRLEVVDVEAVLTRIIEISPLWQERVTLDVAPLLAPVAIDVEHFSRVIGNLLDNADKYAEGATIELTARAVQEEVWIAVVDHGEGIPHEYHDTIFERFTQIERPDTRFKGGTGLGLNIVKDLTESMKGRAWLEQTEGGGATFTLAFPRAEEGTEATVEAGAGMLLVDPSRDRVEAPINMDDLTGSSESPIAQ